VGNLELSQAGGETAGLASDAEAGEPIGQGTSALATKTLDPTS
jgi:hypothetical protein